MSDDAAARLLSRVFGGSPSHWGSGYRAEPIDHAAGPTSRPLKNPNSPRLRRRSPRRAHRPGRRSDFATLRSPARTVSLDERLSFRDFGEAILMFTPMGLSTQSTSLSA